MPTKLILDDLDMVEGFPCVDLQTAANTGDWVAARDFDKVAVVFISGVGTAGDDPTLTIQQATDNAGTGAKALNFATIYRKQAATSLAAVTAWTKTTQTAANTYTNATAAEEPLIWWAEFAGDDLDVANGFDHIRATVADVGGNAQPGYLFYLGRHGRYAQAPANKVSPL